MRYDAAIIGSGPAGLAAALTLAIRRKNFLLFGSERLSASVERSPKIDNYLGLPEITGPQLIARFREHLERMQIALTPEQVLGVYPMDGHFSLTTAGNVYEAQTVILATGAAPTDTLPGEAELLGRGVSYCATCDAPLYKGKTVAVLGWGGHAADEASFIAEIAEQVYYLPMTKHAAPQGKNITPLGGPALEILGNGKTLALRTVQQTLPVDGVFILRESLPTAALVPGIEAQDGHPAVDMHMRTSIPGLYAAGDLTGPPHQLMRATGQGQTAAFAAISHLKG